MLEESNHIMEAESKHKVVLIGDPMVGKTSILSRLTKGYFKTDYCSTVGTGCGVWESSNGHDKTKLQIWDTAGQERYRSLGRIFYHNAEAAVLVVSQAKPWTEKTADEWVKEFQDVAGDETHVIIAANQADISQSDSISIQEWAKRRKFTLVETSAKTGQGVRELFELIALMLRKSNERQSAFTEFKKTIADECKPKFSPCC